MKAISTRYKGCWFRSRIEARWAVFLDAIDLEWEYEPEGFKLENGIWYLPDFYLPEKQLWLEIKGEHPTKADLDKVFFFEVELERSGKGQIYILCGDIPYPYPKAGYAIIGFDAYPGEAVGDSWWTQCPVCSRVGIVMAGREFCRKCWHEAGDLLERWITGSLDAPDLEMLPQLINWEYFVELGGNVSDLQNMSEFDRGFELLPKLLNKELFRSGHKSRKLREAYATARSARFEHGESGRTT